MLKILGLSRELLHSPNRESDDALILKAVMAKLTALGADVRLAEPEKLDEALAEAWDAVVPMCEAYPRLIKLRQWQWENDSLILNAPEAVLNTYRTRMIPYLETAHTVHFPPTEIRRVEGPTAPPPSFFDGVGAWVKRGDVHNTCDRDVMRVRRWEDLAPVLQDFRSREISHFVLQKHIDGDLVKFYGVGPAKWFTWFYHSPEQARKLPFKEAALGQATATAAGALGLEIFGGDAIIGSDGRIYVIDVNSWPSFARVREEASSQIARHVFERARAHADTKVAR